jgi:hypothetical protein
MISATTCSTQKIRHRSSKQAAARSAGEQSDLRRGVDLQRGAGGMDLVAVLALACRKKKVRA